MTKKAKKITALALKAEATLAAAETVEEKAQEALSQRNAIFQPFFQPKEVAGEIRRRQTVTELRKWQLYYAEWGCLVCGRREFEARHNSLGMCSKCFGRVSLRLRRLIQAHTPAPEDQPTFMDTVRLAGEALAPSIEILQEERAITRKRE